MARAARRQAYILHRKLYDTDRKKLAGLVLDGVKDSDCSISTKAIHEHFVKLLRED